MPTVLWFCQPPRNRSQDVSSEIDWPRDVGTLVAAEDPPPYNEIIGPTKPRGEATAPGGEAARRPCAVAGRRWRRNNARRRKPCPLPLGDASKRRLVRPAKADDKKVHRRCLRPRHPTREVLGNAVESPCDQEDQRGAVPQPSPNSGTCGPSSPSASMLEASALASLRCYDRIMKTTIDIPDQELSDAMRFTGAKTKRDAVVTAITDFNRRRRMAELASFAGTCPGMMTVDELRSLRGRRVESVGSG